VDAEILMARPTVAVVLSNYNHGRYLPESLGGICGQTRPADEIIVIDDGSTDDSVAIIEDFAHRYPAIRFVRNEQNLGLQESITRALGLVTADYLAWAAADDRLLPEFLEESMAVLERHPEAGLCFSELSVLKGDTGQVERFALEPSVRHIFDLSDLPEFMTPERIMRRMERAFLPITANSVVVRRDALLAIGGYLRALQWHSDHFAYLVVALRHGACVVPETLALIRAHPGSYSHGGMRDPVRQTVVLTAVLDILGRPDYRDIRRAFRRCPSNFSPWGIQMLELMLRRSRDWDLFVPYFWWKVREYRRGHGLSRPATFWRFGKRALATTRRRLHARHPWLRGPLRRAYDELAGRLGAITAERDGLGGELRRSQEELQSVRHEATAQREHLHARLRAVAVVRDDLEARLNQGVLEQEQVGAQVQATAAERDALYLQLKTVVAERDDLAGQVLALSVEREELRGQFEATAAEREALQEQGQALSTQRDALAEEVRALGAQRDALEERLQALGAERDALSARAGELETETSRLKEELSQIHGDFVSIKTIAEEYRGALEKTRLPPLLITTMPKSGTYYLSKLFGDGLFIGTRIVSHQYFPHDVIRQPELRALSRGNCVSQDHFGASPINLTHIARHVDRLVVHLRDPRQAMLSYVHFLDTKQFRRNEQETLLFIYPPLPDDYYRLEFPAKLDWAIEHWLSLLVEWVAEWVEAAATWDRPRIKFTRFEDLVADRDAFFRDVLAFFGIPLERFIPPRIEPDDEIHFRKGEIDEWRRVFTPAQIAAAAAKIPKPLAARFGWPLKRGRRGRPAPVMGRR
jgi:glycosyltransferase involved in cell wall biosynthesis/uncharacterized coiled-coil DUF342 family protein